MEGGGAGSPRKGGEAQSRGETGMKAGGDKESMSVCYVTSSPRPAFLSYSFTLFYPLFIPWRLARPINLKLTHAVQTETQSPNRHRPRPQTGPTIRRPRQLAPPRLSAAPHGNRRTTQPGAAQRAAIRWPCTPRRFFFFQSENSNNHVFCIEHPIYDRSI